MRKKLPILIFIASFLLVLKASIQYASSKSITSWEDISIKSVGISALVALLIVIVYKILLTKIKIALVIGILLTIVIFFNIYFQV